MNLQRIWLNLGWSALLAIGIVILWRGTITQAQTLTPTPIAIQGTILYNTNLRAGPGPAHVAVGQVRAGQVITVTATSADGNWLQVGDGAWIAAFFVKRALEEMPTATATAPRRLIATVTAALPITQTMTVTSTVTALGTPTGRNLFATELPSATPAVSTTAPAIANRSLRNANLRAGPGTNYAIVGGVQGDDTLDLQGRTSDSTWYQLVDGSWIAAFLVEQNGTALPTVAPTVIAGLPTAAPTATPTPQPTQPPTEDAPSADDLPQPPTVEPPAPLSSGSSTFVVTRRRLWNPWENGGSTDGPSVHCGQGRNLTVNVLDERGNRLNGVAVQAEYGAKEVWITGSQGKGDGVAEFVLGSGQDVKVIRDADGSPVSSEAATGLSTDPRGIDQESLISAGYCQDGGSCQTFANNLSCIGHYSWTVTFERRR